MEIKKVGIIGSGTMGCQMAEFFLQHNFEVTLLSRSADKLHQCRQNFRDKALANKLQTTTDWDDLTGKDIIVECVKEEAGIKQAVLEKIDRVAGENTIIATNSSSMPLGEIAKNCKHRSNVIGLHFSNPVWSMKMAEIPRASFTSDRTVEKTVELVRSVGKDPVVVKDVPGFLFNRIFFLFLNEAANALYDGIASKEEIDKIIKLGAGHPMGPLQVIDLAGVDVTVDILKSLQKQLNDNKYAPSHLLVKMVKENRLGRKTGKGFYSY